jgi:hypothetical protein
MPIIGDKYLPLCLGFLHYSKMSDRPGGPQYREDASRA